MARGVVSHRCNKVLLATPVLLLLLSGCAGMQARREHDEKWAQLWSMDRRLHDQYREGKITYTKAASQLSELNNRLFSAEPYLEEVRAYRVRLAEQVDDGDLDLATAKDRLRTRFVQAVAQANPSMSYQQVRLWRLAVEVVSALEQPRPLSDYRLHIVNTSELNAASYGGGSFTVNSTALDDLTDRQLMALLAHEIAHDTLNHVLKGQILSYVTAVAIAAINLKSPLGARLANNVIRVPVLRAFSRAEEADADAEGVHLLQRIGYSKVEMATMLQELLNRYGNKGGGFLGKHPLTTDRIDAVLALPEDLTWAGPGRAASAKARGFLGITTREIAPEEAKFYRLPSKQAAVIESVVPSGPAASAGLRPWDVVLGFAGAPINGSSHLRQLVRQQAPGAEVNLRVLRASGDQEMTFSIKLSSPPPVTQKSPSSVGPVRLDAFGSP